MRLKRFVQGQKDVNRETFITLSAPHCFTSRRLKAIDADVCVFVTDISS